MQSPGLDASGPATCASTGGLVSAPHSPSILVGRGRPQGSVLSEIRTHLPRKGWSPHQWPRTIRGHRDHPRSFAEDGVAGSPLGSRVELSGPAFPRAEASRKKIH